MSDTNPGRGFYAISFFKYSCCYFYKYQARKINELKLINLLLIKSLKIEKM